MALNHHLADFGIEEMVESEWRQVAEIACAEGDTMCNMAVKVNADRVYQAMVAADALAQRYHD